MDEMQKKTETAQLSQPLVTSETLTHGTSSKWRPNWRKWWLIELWQENREVFKALIVHTVFFVLFIEILSFLEHRIEHSGLPQERKTVLETVDFFLTLIALVIFGVDFIAKLLIHFWRDSHHGGEGQ